MIASFVSTPLCFSTYKVEVTTDDFSRVLRSIPCDSLKIAEQMVTQLNHEFHPEWFTDESPVSVSCETDNLI